MNRLYAVSGHSGAGKSTLMRYVLGTKREIVSVTTRPMRNGEIDGVDYYFINQEVFDELDANNLLAEKTTYYGRASYGVTKMEIENKLARGNAYIIVDFNGYQQLKEIYPDTIGIFIHTGNDTAKERMLSRGDSLQSVDDRLKTYETEMRNQIHYDFIVQNTDFFPTANVIMKIVELK